MFCIVDFIIIVRLHCKIAVIGTVWVSKVGVELTDFFEFSRKNHIENGALHPLFKGKVKS